MVMPQRLIEQRARNVESHRPDFGVNRGEIGDQTQVGRPLQNPDGTDDFEHPTSGDFPAVASTGNSIGSAGDCSLDQVGKSAMNARTISGAFG